MFIRQGDVLGAWTKELGFLQQGSTSPVEIIFYLMNSVKSISLATDQSPISCIFRSHTHASRSSPRQSLITSLRPLSTSASDVATPLEEIL